MERGAYWPPVSVEFCSWSCPVDSQQPWCSRTDGSESLTPRDEEDAV